MKRGRSNKKDEGARKKEDPVELALHRIRAATPIKPRVAVVLGSGLGSFGDRLTSTQVFAYQDIPGFPLPTVLGHSGRLLIGRVQGKPVAVLQGRCHLYEGYTPAQISFPIRVLAGLGARVLVVTSAAGAVSQKLSPGEMMLVEDHLNLMGDNPLRAMRSSQRSIFVNMVSAYDPKLIETAASVAFKLGIPCQRGILAGVLGPSYETPAEVKMLRTLGVDAVCMSTVPEVIMARYLNLQILGLILIVNRAADPSFFGGEHQTGMSGHRQVLEVARERTEQVSAMLERVVEAVGE